MTMDEESYEEYRRAVLDECPAGARRPRGPAQLVGMIS